MNRRTRSLLVILLSSVTGVSVDASQEPATAKTKSPVFTYWHDWTDDRGVSHMTQCEISSFVLQSISKPAEPQWQARQKAGVAQVMVTVQPSGWTGTWHENPKVQWIVPLNGTWFVETMDGKRVELGPGDVSLGEDLNTKADAQGHRGHLSGNVGDGPVTLMVIQLAEQATINQPCRFK